MSDSSSGSDTDTDTGGSSSSRRKRPAHNRIKVKLLGTMGANRNGPPNLCSFLPQVNLEYSDCQSHGTRLIRERILVHLLFMS